MPTHSSMLAWRIPWAEEPGGQATVCFQSLSCLWLFATPWTRAYQAPLSFTNSQSLFKFMSIESVILSNHPLPFSSPFAFNLFQHQGLFQWVGSLHQVTKVVMLQLQHQSSNEYSGLISFKIDWFNLLAVQGTLRSLLQHHNLKASILWHSAFYVVQLVMCNYPKEAGDKHVNQTVNSSWVHPHTGPGAGDLRINKAGSQTPKITIGMVPGGSMPILSVTLMGLKRITKHHSHQHCWGFILLWLHQ